MQTPRHSRCRACDTLLPTAKILKAPNPFNLNDIVEGCPKCKAVTQFVPVCDMAGCRSDGTCGMPTPGGYLWLCHIHYSEKRLYGLHR